jgi:hypothetical protein
MSIFLGSTLSMMGSIKFWIMLWRLEVDNGEGANKKLTCISMWMHSKKIKVQNLYALNGERKNGKPKDIVLLCEVHSKNIMVQMFLLNHLIWFRYSLVRIGFSMLG